MPGWTRTENARLRMAFGAWGCPGASWPWYTVNALSCDSTCRLRDLSPCSRSGWGFFMIPLLNSAQPQLAQPGLEFRWKDTKDPPRCWGSAHVTIQPSSSSYHPIFLTMDSFHRCGITLSAIQHGLWWRGVALAFSHYEACEHHVHGAAPHGTAWELVGKACALAQDRWHTGKWELGRNSSDGWYIHLFPSIE